MEESTAYFVENDFFKEQSKLALATVNLDPVVISVIKQLQQVLMISALEEEVVEGELSKTTQLQVAQAFARRCFDVSQCTYTATTPSFKFMMADFVEPVLHDFHIESINVLFLLSQKLLHGATPFAFEPFRIESLVDKAQVTIRLARSLDASFREDYVCEDGKSLKSGFTIDRCIVDFKAKCLKFKAEEAKMRAGKKLAGGDVDQFGEWDDLVDGVGLLLC